MLKLSKLVFIFPIILFLVLAVSPGRVMAVCSGAVQCLKKEWISEPLSFDCMDYRVAGGGSCTNTGTSAECSQQEVNLQASCPADDKPCYVGACTWGSTGGGPTPTEVPSGTGCTTGSWVDKGCGLGSCAGTQMYQVRTTNPLDCSISTRCVTNASCSPSKSCTPPGPWNSQGCGLGGCSTTQMYQTRTGNSSCDILTQCVNDSSCEPRACPAWKDIGCGNGGCPANLMHQSRSTGDPNCALDQCVASSCCLTSSSCSIINDGQHIVLNTGETKTFSPFPGYSQVNGTVNSINYSIPVNSTISICADDGTANPCPAGGTSVVDNSMAFGVKSTLFGVGNVNMLIKATITGSPTASCSGIVSIGGGTNISPWWQTAGGDVISEGSNIRSDISTYCTAALGCYPYLIMDNIVPNWAQFLSPGIASVIGSFALPSKPTSFSIEKWNVKNTLDSGTNFYSYAYFYNKVKAKADSAAAAVNNGNIKTKLQGGCVSGDGNYLSGYCIYKSDTNDLTISDSINILDKKVLLLVPGNLTINNATSVVKLNMTKGLGFLMAAAGKNIMIGANVGSKTSLVYPAAPNSPQPDIEGIFFANDAFITESKGRDIDNNCQDNFVHIRGSIVTLGNTSSNGNGIDFRRCLSDNSRSPAELIEAAPDLFLRFPPFLGKTSIEWNEVQP